VAGLLEEQQDNGTSTTEALPVVVIQIRNRFTSSGRFCLAFMCHNHSPAPPVAPDIRRHLRTTPDSAAVPYVLLEAGIATPDTPAIVIVTDIFGVTPFYEYLGAQLAREGWRVAVPDLFHRIGPVYDGSRDAALARRRLLDDSLAAADVDAVISSVAKSTEATVTSDRPGFGLLGFCIGGSFALLSAAAHPEQTTVTYYAFPRGAPGAAVSTTEPLAVASQIRGPVLGFWGMEDYIDAGEVEALKQELSRGQVDHEVRWYENAGHSFLAGLTRDDETSTAARDSWQRSIAFFHDSLDPRSVL
jgi:carboxymethylenebutenolidase